MAPRSKVHTLPPELKEWLDGELVARGFGDYVQLAADLKARGAQVSKSALQRYGSPFEKRMAQVKMSTEQARALVDAAPDDEDKLGAAVVRLTQERIFGLLVDLEIDPENVDVNKLFKNAAEIGKASVTQKKFSQSVRAEIEAAARKALIDEQRGKLDALAGDVRAEGWAWVEAVPHMSYAERQAFQNAPRQRREPTAREARRIASLQSRLDKIDAASQHLLETINTVLDLSKIDAGKLELEETALDVDSLLASAAAMVQDKATARQVALIVHRLPEALTLRGGEERAARGVRERRRAPVHRRDHAPHREGAVVVEVLAEELQRLDDGRGAHGAAHRRGLAAVHHQAQQLGPRVVAHRIHHAFALGDQAHVQVGDHHAFAFLQGRRQVHALGRDYGRAATTTQRLLQPSIRRERLDLRVRQPKKVAHLSVSLRSLNHATSARSMGPDPRCLIPRFDGAILSLEWKEALWARYVTGAPRPRTPSEQQYSDRKLRSRR